MFDNEHANQGSQCSSVRTYTLVLHNVALYQLGGAQDDFACSLSNFFLMVYNAVLSVSVSICLSISDWSHAYVRHLLMFRHVGHLQSITLLIVLMPTLPGLLLRPFS